MGWLGNLFSGAGNALKGLFGSVGSTGSSLAGGTTQSFLSPQQLSQQNAFNSGGFGIGKGISNLFGGKQGIAGLGLMGLGSMLPNTKTPSMPPEFSNYMGMLNQGGTPGMQSAQQYYQGVLSGKNQGAYDAATVGIDEAMEEERRKLISMYKSIRPGTDPSNDATFQRDMASLEDRYARNRALAMAGVQQGAASGAAGLGGQLSQMQGSAVQNYVDMIATQWGMNQSQRQALRDSIMGLGGKMITGPMDIQQLLAQMQAMKAAGGING